jgi:hypothetical protein
MRPHPHFALIPSIIPFLAFAIVFFRASGTPTTADVHIVVRLRELDVTAFEQSHEGIVCLFPPLRVKKEEEYCSVLGGEDVLGGCEQVGVKSGAVEGVELGYGPRGLNVNVGF